MKSFFNRYGGYEEEAFKVEKQITPILKEIFSQYDDPADIRLVSKIIIDQVGLQECFHSVHKSIELRLKECEQNGKLPEV